MEDYYDEKLYNKLRNYFISNKDSNIQTEVLVDSETKFENYFWEKCNIKFQIISDFKIQDNKSLNNKFVKKFVCDEDKHILFLYENKFVEILFVCTNKNNILDEYKKSIFQNSMNIPLKDYILNKNTDFHIVEYREISNINKYHLIFERYINNKYILVECVCLNSSSEQLKKVFEKVIFSIERGV